MGAEASLSLAASHPDVPRAIFLEDPPILLPGETAFGGDLAMDNKKALRIMQWVMILFKTLPVPLGKALVRRLMPYAHEDEIVPWILSKKRMDRGFFRSLVDEGAHFPDPFEVAKKVEVPALLLMGDRDQGAMVSTKAAEMLAEAMPGLQIAHLQGANHDVRRKRFEGYMTALRTFLAKVHV
jgi:pimeloyl-ACP methyl ester carboxylesterase